MSTVQTGSSMNPRSTLSIDVFSDAVAVRGVAAADERLVCLQFPEGRGSLYCFLSFSSPVLRNVLEDIQQQGQLCTIPLAGDSDVDAWKLALGLIYHLESAAIAMDNAQALLLLAHKYDMRGITSEVQQFMMGAHGVRAAAVADSRLKHSLSPSTVCSWLAVFSKCGLDRQVQMCIDYILDQQVPMDIDVSHLQTTHANMLLTAMQRKLSTARSAATQATSSRHVPFNHRPLRREQLLGDDQVWKDAVMSLYEQ